MKAPQRSAGPVEGFLTHPLLAELGVQHGFGLRESPEVPGLLQPRQVHGCEVLRVTEDTEAPLGPGDAVVSTAPARPVAVVTADCVPILIASRDGAAVAAVHAGWRGLARGVVAAAVRVLRETCPSAAHPFAAVGPHIGPCCYEVDEPVIAALRERFDAALDDASTRARPGHVRLDLGRLVRADLEAVGLPAEQVGAIEAACTRCDAQRFHSYRRDGERAGRLRHWIAAGRPFRG